MRALIHFMAATLTVILIAGCAGTVPEPRTVQGECANAFDANVCTWATLDGADRVIEFGATVPLAAVERAPHDMEMAWPPLATAIIRMPAEVTAATGVDHLTIYWEPHGHPPGAYLTPHFDFHFYNLSTGARDAIDCADETKPSAIPAEYGLVDIDIPELGMLVGLCVPEMGMHALLASEIESDAIFEGTMVIGYYHGAPIFFEPMIARDMLMRRQSFDLPMPTVSGLPQNVRYPQRFRAEYDVAADAYRFIFSGI
jgi:hypothetical protein